jgi:lipoprotein NlpD
MVLPPANAASAPTKVASAPGAPAPLANGQSPATEDDIIFSWPSKGEVLDGFDEAKNRKGVDIGGASGDPVWAAADGKVVYADSGLRGYGKLIILKHNNLYLTAYAHNQTLLVKEDQMVKKGQKIAEMGSTDSDRVKLHFEVRKQGKPVDPSKYLPAR